MNATTPVPAAGAVVWRPAADDVDVLLVHRPRYDDWSLPKGKLDPGENLLATAVREVAEETGVVARLGPPLPTQEYATSPGVTKRVSYWAARPVGADDEHSGEDCDESSDVTTRLPDDEVDEVAWVRLGEARATLTYPRDVDLLDAFAVSAYRTEPLVVLRHAAALPRETWSGDDRARGLSAEGEAQARRLVPLLQAYGVRRAVSSDTVRCTTTLQPYAHEAGVRVQVDHRLAEDGARRTDPAGSLRSLLQHDEPLVLCSHRPVLPALFETLGVPATALRPGGFVVVHRQGGQALATEVHQP